MKLKYLILAILIIMLPSSSGGINKTIAPVTNEEKKQDRDDNFNEFDSEELYFGNILGLMGKVSINQIHKNVSQHLWI